VPAFEGLDLDGKPANVSYSGKQKHLLFIFSTNCAACAKQIPVWAGIVTPAKEKNCIVQGVSVDSVDDTRAFFADKDQAFDIIVPQRSILPNVSDRRYPSGLGSSLRKPSGLGKERFTHRRCRFRTLLSKI